MKRYEPGDKSRAVCEKCAAVRPTTFVYRDVPFSDGRGMACDILVAVCDFCDDVVATPPQSTPAIRRARREASVSVEARIPAPAMDILDLALQCLDTTSTTEFRKALLVYFAADLAADEKGPAALKALDERYRALLEKHKAQPMRRLSFKVSKRAYEPIDQLVKDSTISRTHVLGCLIMRIEQDILQPNGARKAKELPIWTRALVG